MDDEKTVDVRVQIQLPADLYFSDTVEPVESVRLIDSADLQVTILKSEHYFSPHLNIKTKIEKIERILIVPNIEIVLKERIFHSNELAVKRGKLLISADDPRNSNWYKVARDVVFIYNSIIDEMFRMYPDEPWQRIKAPRLSTDSYSFSLSDFPYCLDSWHTEFKETSKQRWRRVDRFNTDSNIEDKYNGSKIALVDIDSEKLRSIDVALRAILQSSARLPIGWDYLYRATQYLDEGNVRNAVIDLDIAIDFAVRQRIRNNIDLDEKYIDKILDKCSTGDLLLIAQTQAKDQSELETWDALKELHTLRGTVIHKYQRRFSNKQLETIERARSSIVSILRDLGKT